MQGDHVRNGFEFESDSSLIRKGEGNEIYREAFYRISLINNVADIWFFESSQICVRLHACAKFALLAGCHSITTVRTASFQICLLQYISLNFPASNIFCIITNISGVLVPSFQICIIQHTSLNFPVSNVFCIITNISENQFVLKAHSCHKPLKKHRSFQIELFPIFVHALTLVYHAVPLNALR